MSKNKRNKQNISHLNEFVSNGEVSDIVGSSILLNRMFSGLSPESEIEYDKMKACKYAFSNANGVISTKGCHIFSKCKNNNCYVCAKYLLTTKLTGVSLCY